MNTVRVLACVLLLCAAAAKCGEETLTIPNTPDGTLRAVAQGLAENKPDVVWAALPAGYQKDVSELVRLFAEKIDAEVYDKGAALARKLVVVLKTKKAFFLNQPLLASVKFDAARKSEGWDKIVRLAETLLESELSGSAALKSLDVEKFLRGTGRKVLEQLAEVSKSFEGDVVNTEFRDKLRVTTFTLLSSQGDSARVDIALSGEPRRSAIDLVRIEGKWIPKELAAAWPEYSASARKSVERLDKDRMFRANMQALAAMGGIEAVLDQLAKADTQEKFDALGELALKELYLKGPEILAASRPKERVYRAQCMNNLRMLGQLSMLYADDNKQWYPVAPGESPKAHESFQILVNAMQDARNPALYVCPGSSTKPVQGVNKDSGKPFTLTAANVSYAWRTKRLRATSVNGSIVLACDNSLDNHGGQGVNVLYIDGAVKWVPKEELGEGGLEGFLLKHNLSR